MSLSSSSLIAVIGKKGAGKDTLSEVLFERGYENVKFAGGLKAMLATLLAYQGADEATINRMIEGDLKEVPTPLLQGKTPRHAMQTLGNEWGRELIGEDLWVDAMVKRLDTCPKAVVTDCRYPNELALLRERGASAVRVRASDEKSEDGHESEAHIDNLEVDAEFLNDKSEGVFYGRMQFAAFIDRKE